ncbi:MAG: TrkH family potassium uptake protein [Eubacteriales bacterium]|nr:TrkH family potassium uptake protein [Eubacteriales bacterium]
MNHRIVVKVLGYLLIIESFLMLPPLLISLYYAQDDTFAFIITIVMLAILGFLLTSVKAPGRSIKTREGLSIVTLGWLLTSFFGCLPFVFSGYIPSIVDAMFESISGFTTTGATILSDVEALPNGLLFWRSFTHWIGGMGILVFTVALLPALGVGGFQIFKAESPGPTTDKISPKIKNTAKALYISYIVMTVVEIILLMFGGMSFLDSCIHTFGTVGTGGFSSKNLSVGYYDSTYIHVVMGVFMVLASSNFGLYYLLYKRRFKEVAKNEELKFFLGVVATSTILIALNLLMTTYKSVGLSIRDSFFQVTSIISTSGFSTVNFDLWPTFSKAILFLLMFFGGCAGSTAGAIKNIRILVLLKLIKREVTKIFHPRAVVPIKVGGKPVANDTLLGISGFFIFYLSLFVIGTLIVSFDGQSLESSASAVAATLGNVGPGFGFVGPTTNYGGLSDLSTITLTILMLLGRLEIFTVIALISPKSWRNQL